MKGNTTMPTNKTDVKNLPRTYLYVCPRCTVTRYSKSNSQTGDMECPVCGYDQAPDRVVLDDD